MWTTCKRGGRRTLPLVQCWDGNRLDLVGTPLPPTITPTPTAMPTIAERDLAPSFTFTLYQGENKLGARELDLAQLRDKPVVLNFWAGLCPPCRAEMPDLQAFYDQFKDRVTLIGIDLGRFTGLGSEQDARDLLQDLDITYPARIHQRRRRSW